MRSISRLTSEMTFQETPAFKEPVQSYYWSRQVLMEGTGAWCHLGLSRYLDAVNPDVAEHHEAMGFQHASNHNDLEAMVS